MGRGRSSTLVNRNVTIRGRRTSLRLEPAMWDALHAIARREGASVHELCSRIELSRRESTLTAAIRVFILGYYREAATEQGHSLAGHGRRRGAFASAADSFAGQAGLAEDGGNGGGPQDDDQATDDVAHRRRPRLR